MPEITPTICIPDHEINFEYICSSGPGGQNVNKVATGVQLFFNIRDSQSLSEEIKSRLIKIGGKRVTQEGTLVIDARRFRTQEQNRKDALARLSAMIIKASVTEKARKATQPGVSARASRLFEKKRRAEIKRTRRYVPGDYE